MTAITCDSMGYTAGAMPTAGAATRKRTTARKARVVTRDFGNVFNVLRELLSPYECDLAVQSDKPGHCWLESRTPTYKNRPMYFAGVRLGKNYVSYHLMSVYACPELLKIMSPELKRRMQGKSCFNFTTIDQDLFAELGKLTRAGYKKFKSMKYL